MKKFVAYWRGKGFSPPTSPVPAGGGFDSERTTRTKTGIAASDPRVYVEITEGRRSLSETTPFVLCNKGQEVAHRVQILSIELSGHSVTFELVDNISSGAKDEVLPDIHDFSPLSLYNLRPLLEREWNDRDQLTDELIIPMSATYEDFAKQRFQVNFDLVYLPLKDITQRSHLGEGLREVEPVIKIRNTEFLRL